MTYIVLVNLFVFELLLEAILSCPLMLFYMIRQCLALLCVLVQRLLAAALTKKFFFLTNILHPTFRSRP